MNFILVVVNRDGSKSIQDNIFSSRLSLEEYKENKLPKLLMTLKKLDYNISSIELYSLECICTEFEK